MSGPSDDRKAKPRGERWARVPRSVLLDHKLGPSGLAVYAAIMVHWNKKLRRAWPSQTVVAEVAGVDVRTVRRAVLVLVARGHLVVRTGNGRGNPTYYWRPEDWKGGPG